MIAIAVSLRHTDTDTVFFDSGAHNSPANPLCAYTLHPFHNYAKWYDQMAGKQTPSKNKLKP